MRSGAERNDDRLRRQQEEETYKGRRSIGASGRRG